ncbi:hypothetical protein LJB98_00685 [Bacteroidales bacterium OttesenSCG-928-M11]|nr:hypothetical protein [Bacteroidales bacterium OttesenSCG-928-M11]
MMSLLDKYKELNNSFENKKLVFHLGADAGFFSEYNNMILTMLYCLENRIRFVLYSEDANFGVGEGWRDYFLPFCEEERDKFHAKYNFRYKSIFKKLRPQVILYHLLNKNNYLTFELIDAARQRDREQKTFCVPELNIDGTLQDACRRLIELTWKYNLETEEEVNRLISSLDLPEEYIGFHIRSGDKYKEFDLLNISEYIKKAQGLSSIRNAFVMTDDYLIVEAFQKQHQEWNVYTLCEKEERGYFHQKFQKKEKDTIKKAHQRLFASIDILNNSRLFIGTFSSNPGMYLGMRMDSNKCFGVDLEKWQIW